MTNNNAKKNVKKAIQPTLSDIWNNAKSKFNPESITPVPTPLNASTSSLFGKISSSCNGSSTAAEENKKPKKIDFATKLAEEIKKTKTRADPFASEIPVKTGK